MNDIALSVLAATKEKFPEKETFSRGDIYHTGRSMGYTKAKFKELFTDIYRVSHGKYCFNILGDEK